MKLKFHGVVAYTKRLHRAKDQIPIIMRDRTRRDGRLLLSKVISLSEQHESPHYEENGSYSSFKDSWKMSKVRSRGKGYSTEYVVTIDNDANWTYKGTTYYYASWVEYGHNQHPNQYVPLPWLGKRLKASYVEGIGVMRTAQEELLASNNRFKMTLDLISKLLE